MEGKFTMDSREVLVTNGLIKKEMVHLFTEMFAGARVDGDSFGGGVCGEDGWRRSRVRKRRTARVMLFDEAGDVLLIRFVVPRDGWGVCLLGFAGW